MMLSVLAAEPATAIPGTINATAINPRTYSSPMLIDWTMLETRDLKATTDGMEVLFAKASQVMWAMMKRPASAKFVLPFPAFRLGKNYCFS
jgi:hypothetical protein